jgi:hypothetical protein
MFWDNLAVLSSRVKQSKNSWTGWLTGCPKMSVTKYQKMLGNIPEQQRCQREITAKVCFIVTFLIFIPQIMLHKEAEGVFMT